MLLGGEGYVAVILGEPSYRSFVDTCLTYAYVCTHAEGQKLPVIFFTKKICLFIC